MKNENLQKLYYTLGVCALLPIVAYLFFKFLAPAFSPVFIGILLSATVKPISKFLSKKAHVPHKICSLVIILIVVFGMGYTVFQVFGKLTIQCRGLLEDIAKSLESEDSFLTRFPDYLRDIKRRLPFIPDSFETTGSYLSEELSKALSESVKQLLIKFGAFLTSFAAGMVKAFPNFIFAFTLTLTCTYYLSFDKSTVKDSIKRLIPEGLWAAATNAYTNISGAVYGYIKAYAAIMMLSFTELFVGFLILKIDYAFLLAVLIAIIDIFPVLGVGTVLIPWSLVLFFEGNTAVAAGLLILFGIMSWIRQFAEAHLLGKFMGLHPLITLAGGYLGLRFFGFWGMLYTPIIIYVIKITVNNKRNL